MKVRSSLLSLCGGAILISTAGCQSAAHCCTSFFANREATTADSTAIPERESYVQPTSLENSSSETTDTGDSGELKNRQRRFKIPAELPGANASPLVMPPMDATQSTEQRRSLAESLFPEVSAATESTARVADAGELSLAAFQQMALENSPVIRQAAANVENARGAAVQAGLYPNPTVGYEGDTIGTSRTAGYNGIFFTQEFVTAGKLSLKQSAALNEMQATQADLRKARISLASNVRRNYFTVLIAQERLRFSRSIAKLSNEAYKAQIDLVTGGESAPYEPLQLRVFAVQARNNVVLATNGLDGSWRQLAATIGLPYMARQTVAGSVETMTPAVDYDTLIAILQRHTDLTAANLRIASSRNSLRLAEVQPIPNITVYSAFQNDATTPLDNFSANVQVSAPMPVFNRNQGNIASAHADLVRAEQNLNDTNNKLMSSLADAYSRFTSSRTISESYRTELLPDQVRVYRGVYDRFLIDGESIDFAQVVVAQQTLATVVTSYLQSLNDVWIATVDLAELLQVDDLMTMDGVADNQMAVQPAESETTIIEEQR